MSGAVIGTAVGAAAGAALAAAAGNPAIGAAAGAGVGLLGGTVAGASAGIGTQDAAQRRFDNTYMQCMYVKGNQIPVARGTVPSGSAGPRARRSACSRRRRTLRRHLRRRPARRRLLRPANLASAHRAADSTGRPAT